MTTTPNYASFVTTSYKLDQILILVHGNIFLYKETRWTSFEFNVVSCDYVFLLNLGCFLVEEKCQRKKSKL
uniref:Uncharacterized protein n=1 Tax=Arundo donax TaxID=35708 RepID=A0A0A9AQW5_ARUDO